jgi:hypothetical protein
MDLISFKAFPPRIDKALIPLGHELTGFFKQRDGIWKRNHS